MDKDFFNFNYGKSAMQINDEKNTKIYIKNIIVVVIVCVCGLIYVTRPENKKNEMHIKDNTAPKVASDNISKSNIEIEKYEETNPVTNIQSTNDEIKIEEDSNKNIQNKIIEDKRDINFILVNINTANPKELEKINGIGPAIAKNIIEYRTKHGGFAHKEEIKNVKRVGTKLYNKIKDYITVD